MTIKEQARKEICLLYIHVYIRLLHYLHFQLAGLSEHRNGGRISLHIVKIKADNVIGGQQATVVRMVNFNNNAEHKVDNEKPFRLRIKNT